MINKNLKIDRKYVQDYEIITEEVSVKTVKLFGITIFRNTIDVKNNNDEEHTPARKPTGFKTSKS